MQYFDSSLWEIISAATVWKRRRQRDSGQTNPMQKHTEGLEMGQHIREKEVRPGTHYNNEKAHV